MPNLVSSVRIPELITKLRDGEFLIPQFQREFVWSTSDVVALLNSVLDARPIGMLTIWEQPDNSGLELEHISIPDGSAADDPFKVTHFGDNSERPSRFYAVLDGRQRSTALAMAFGGLNATDARRKYSGKYYLNVAASEPVDRILFIRSSDIQKRKLSTLANAISAGLFPFEMDFESYDDLDKQWMGYIEKISNPEYYVEGQLPEKAELERRKETLRNAFNGIIDTTFAVYTVPKKYDLGTICEIFETLNTTGTRVSTVDLIHSWLYSDTSTSKGAPLLLRDWISELGQLDGAFGWADPSERPELIAQIATACYLAEESPPAPRAIGGTSHKIGSVKSSDLLATPSSHWQNVIQHKERIATFMGDFQNCVSKGPFPMRDCPYPISSGIYVALRWTKFIDSRAWSIDDINTVYRSFFWRNCLSGRYDQGFLTKMSADLALLKKLLDQRAEFKNFADWANYVDSELSREVCSEIGVDQVTRQLLDGKPTGALAKALALPLKTYPKRDLVDPSKGIQFGNSAEPVEIHHIFPKDWIKNNISAETQSSWSDSGLGHVNCIANLTPMLRSSNQIWKAKVPGNALSDRGVTRRTHPDVLDSHFLNDEVFEQLTNKTSTVTDFWRTRAKLIAAELNKMSQVRA